MARLSQKARKSIDQAVLGAAEQLFREKKEHELHFTKPERFALSVYKLRALRHDLMGAIGVLGMPEEEQIEVIQRSLRRLEHQKKLKRTRTRVHVILKSKDTPGAVLREKVCYWPVNLLEELANC